MLYYFISDVLLISSGWANIQDSRCSQSQRKCEVRITISPVSVCSIVT